MLAAVAGGKLQPEQLPLGVNKCGEGPHRYACAFAGLAGEKGGGSEIVVYGMSKVRVGGDAWPAALKDEGWRYVVALAATVAAIGSNQEQAKGN